MAVRNTTHWNQSNYSPPSLTQIARFTPNLLSRKLADISLHMEYISY